MTKPIVGCAPGDDCFIVLRAMEQKVRRLPVLGIGGVLLGMVSMNDIVARAAKAPPSAEGCSALGDGRRKIELDTQHVRSSGACIPATSRSKKPAGERWGVRIGLPGAQGVHTS
jgi:CBS domain